MLDVLRSFLILGLTSFGGPAAHIGYFRNEFVERKRWIDGKEFADLVALCQFLPGPASSQLGFAIGMRRVGLAGGIAAFLAFTLPSGIAMILLGLGVAAFGGLDPGLTHGLKLAAVAVIAQAVWAMGKSFCADAKRASVMALSAILVLVLEGAFVQMAAIALGGLAGLLIAPSEESANSLHANEGTNHALSLASLSLFGLLLLGLPWLGEFQPFAAIYRAGSLVFGGGHVILPLLRAEFVTPGWVEDSVFLAGYGAAQALPGPLFTFAGFLGAVMTPSPNGLAGGLLGLVAAFLPGFLLLIAALPYWEKIKHQAIVRRMLTGINAAVVGLLLAALYHPVATSSLTGPASFAIALAAFVLLVFWRLPPWMAVASCALAGSLFLN